MLSTDEFLDKPTLQVRLAAPIEARLASPQCVLEAPPALPPRARLAGTRPLTPPPLRARRPRLHLHTRPQRILASGHSRIPVYEGADRSRIQGLIIVKELLQYVGLIAGPQVRKQGLGLAVNVARRQRAFPYLNAFCPNSHHDNVLLQPAPPLYPPTPDPPPQPPPSIGDIELRDVLRLPVNTPMYHLLDIFQVRSNPGQTAVKPRSQTLLPRAAPRRAAPRRAALPPRTRACSHAACFPPVPHPRRPARRTWRC
jgi:hypothetical protein